MTVILSADLNEIDDCDMVTNWSSNETIGVDTESKREGTGSIGIEKVSQETSYAQYDYYTDHGNTYLDITGETHIYFWVQIQGVFDTKANGGIRLRLTDSAGNYEEWWIGGSEDYYGGFQNYVIYTGTTPDDSSGTLIHNQIRYVTVYFKLISKTVVGAYNCWVDILYEGTGLIVKGGTAGDKGTFDEIIAADEVPAYGVMQKKYGAFVLQGPITFGDETGVTSTYFKDESQIVLFADAMVSDTHYEIKVVGNATGTNSFELGSKVGTSGVSGCIVKAVSAKKFKFTATDVNVDIMKVYGSILLDAGIVSLPVNAVNKEVVSCNFELCAKVLVSTCVVKYCKFISPDSISLEITSTSFNVTDCDFINAAYGVEISVAGIYTFDAMMFSGCTTDIHNTSGGSVTVNCTNGSNPGTFTGDTTINNSVYLTIWVKDEAGNPINLAQCAIYKSSDDSQLMNEDSDANGNAEETFNYTTDTDVYFRVRKSSPGVTRYFPVRGTGTIISSGFTAYVTLVEDKIAEP